MRRPTQKLTMDVYVFCAAATWSHRIEDAENILLTFLSSIYLLTLLIYTYQVDDLY